MKNARATAASPLEAMEQEEAKAVTSKFSMSFPRLNAPS